MGSAPPEHWKSLCITHLATCPNQNSPTDSADEAFHVQFTGVMYYAIRYVADKDCRPRWRRRTALGTGSGGAGTGCCPGAGSDNLARGIRVGRGRVHQSHMGSAPHQARWCHGLGRKHWPFRCNRYGFLQVVRYWRAIASGSGGQVVDRPGVHRTPSLQCARRIRRKRSERGASFNAAGIRGGTFSQQIHVRAPQGRGVVTFLV